MRATLLQCDMAISFIFMQILQVESFVLWKKLPFLEKSKLKQLFVDT